jgi:hypothetical protein
VVLVVEIEDVVVTTIEVVVVVDKAEVVVDVSIDVVVEGCGSIHVSLSSSQMVPAGQGFSA